ncbi:MAG: cytochrome c [Candidatus Omnitrophica bacterium]|nr:cytochrome c [Candidatus Omnitrophota bacterium]MDE2222887.1 cytochrome c [Candidatus Omnitrophota bacterium]
MNRAILILCYLSVLPSMALADTGKGRQLYLSYGCALCHGLDGRGDGLNASKFDPPPTNFHDLRTYRHGSGRDSLRSAISYGIKEEGSIMPSFEHIPPGEMDQIIDYLQSLKQKPLLNQSKT